jgi:hypothetical protein
MTRQQAITTARQLGFSLRWTGYDYRLARPGRGQEAAAYYTDDLEDALATAAHWNAREVR